MAGVYPPFCVEEPCSLLLCTAVRALWGGLRTVFLGNNSCRSGTKSVPALANILEDRLAVKILEGLFEKILERRVRF